MFKNEEEKEEKEQFLKLGSHGYETTSVSLPRHMRAVVQFSPLLARLPTDNVWLFIAELAIS